MSEGLRIWRRIKESEAADEFEKIINHPGIVVNEPENGHETYALRDFGYRSPPAAIPKLTSDAEAKPDDKVKLN